MKREFEVKCTYENEYLVRTIVNGFYRCNPIKPTLVRTFNNGHTIIHFKCMRSKLADCRLVLGRMLNEGVLLGVEEIW